MTNGEFEVRQVDGFTVKPLQRSRADMTIIQDYLLSLPEYDKQGIKRVIEENVDNYKIATLSDEDFQYILNQLQTIGLPLARFEKGEAKSDPQAFNEFFSNAGIDLEKMYHYHIETEKVIANYDRILKGVLGSLESEVSRLQERIEELNLTIEREDGLVIRSYGFEDERRNDYMENDRQTYAHLFTDRDGSPLKDNTLVRQFHQYYLSLPHDRKIDAMRDQFGNTTAKIKTLFHYANAQNSPDHPLEHAIDDSNETYWSEVVTSRGPLQTTIHKHLEPKPAVLQSNE
jgi:hypothetical protein